MSPEAVRLSIPVGQELAGAVEAVFEEVFYLERFGITLEEAEQTVQAGRWTGTLGQMLTDPKCPVGEAVQQAHQEGGREAAQQKLTSLQAFYPEFSVKFEERPEADTTKKKLK